jgi:hypothetical protein
MAQASMNRFSSWTSRSAPANAGKGNFHCDVSNLRLQVIPPRSGRCLICASVLGLALGAAGGWAGEDAGTRALQQHQLQRQQQQDVLQLQMRQQHRAVQSPPADSRQKQSLGQMHREQRQHQQALHYRQAIEPPATQPSDDRGTRAAKEAIRGLNARQESQQEMQRPGRGP